MTRKSIPEAIKLQLWVKSAGRCEFKGCNTPVWYNGLTLSGGNFGEVSHTAISAVMRYSNNNEQTNFLNVENLLS